MGNKIYEYLEDFMIENNWGNEHVPEQAKSFFTTLCFMERMDIDTAKTDNFLKNLYWRAAMEEIMEYEDFVQFMVEFII